MPFSCLKRQMPLTVKPHQGKSHNLRRLWKVARNFIVYQVLSWLILAYISKSCNGLTKSNQEELIYIHIKIEGTWGVIHKVFTLHFVNCTLSYTLRLPTPRNVHEMYQSILFLLQNRVQPNTYKISQPLLRLEYRMTQTALACSRVQLGSTIVTLAIYLQ